MNFIRKSVSVLCASAIAATMAVPTFAEEKSTAMRDMTTQQIVEDMGLGVNLGNTFEAIGNETTWGKPANGGETAWGSPKITKEIIQGYADSGFGVLRVPVAWSLNMGDDYTLDPTYVARVKEVVDWAIDDGMYVILNIHWDGGWWSNFSNDSKKSECMYRYTRMWTQLCEAFGDESDYLMFESLNEEGGWDDIWNRYGSSTGDAKKKSYDLLNEINQKFVDIVRKSGGNNAKRHLLIAGYGTDVDLTCDELFKMPTDSAKRCAVSVHYYSPSTFAVIDADTSWGKAQDTWGTDSEIKYLQSEMKKLKQTFVDKGVPVIIGEYGVASKNKSLYQIRNYLSKVADESYSRGMCPVLWDINYTEDLGTKYDHKLSVYSRYNYKLNDPLLATAYKKIVTDGRDQMDSSKDLEDISAASTSCALQTYTGKALKPAVTVSFNGKTLKAGTDYTVTYTNNIKVGTGKYTIKGIGGFKGTKTGTFAIKKGISSLKFSSVKSQTYTGSALKPSITVKDGTKVLVKGTDYTISYLKNKNIGQAKMIIRFKGNYTGAKTVYFNIVPKKQAIKSVSGVSKGIKVTYTKNSAATGYQIKYASKKDFSNGKSVWVKTKSTVSKTIKGRVSGKKYYVKVRTYTTVNGVKYYGAWSTVKTVRAK